MKDEITAREEFEKRVNSSSDETRKKVDSMENWLLGLFSTVIASLFGFAVVLLKRTAFLYRTVQALEGELKTQQKEPAHVINLCISQKRLQKICFRSTSQLHEPITYFLLEISELRMVAFLLG